MVEPPQTHVQLPHRPDSLFCTVPDTLPLPASSACWRRYMYMYVPELLEPLYYRGYRVISQEFNAFEPVQTTVQYREPGLWGSSHEFRVVQPYRTSSNHCSTEVYRVISYEFNASEPIRTTVDHREPGLWGSFT